MIADLKRRFNALKQEQPALRARNAADILGVSEGELLACRLGEGVTRLTDEIEAMLSNLVPLGEVMALTRNQSCVHERKGIYDNAQFMNMGPKMRAGLFVNEDIDLRLFLGHWKHAFAVTEGADDRPRHSLQFFDKSGMAVHKIYLTNHSDKRAYDSFVATYRADVQQPGMQTEIYENPLIDLPDEDVDWDGFRRSWENLKDTHDFFPMLRKFKVGREQGFRHIGRDFAYEVDVSAARNLLDRAARQQCEIMVFTGNRGCIQIHSGPVKKLVAHGTWYNVLDPKFNLHLDEQRIARIWVTKKPTIDGIVTAVEVFDLDGELIVTFFGKRKPGIPELTLWRQIVAELPARAVQDAA